MAVKFFPPIVQIARLAMGRPEDSGQLSLLWLLATACEQNLPLASSVESLSANASGQWQYLLTDLAGLLRRGVPVDQAIQRVPGILPPDAVLAAKIGAANGSLGKSLRVEAERQSLLQADDHDTSIMGTFSYFCMMSMMFMLLVAYVMTNIMPRMKKIFDDFDTELPAVTLGFIDPNWAVTSLILAPIAIATLMLPLLSVLWMFGVWKPVFLNPVKFFPRLDVGPVLRQLGVVVAQGTPIVDGLHVVSTQHSNTSTWKNMSYVYEAVKAGENPWAAMQQRKLLRARERHLLESAERAGNLGWTLQLVGRRMEDRQDHIIKSLLQFVRPITIVMVGAFVGWFAIAMFVPLIKLLNDLA